MRKNCRKSPPRETRRAFIQKAAGAAVTVAGTALVQTGHGAGEAAAKVTIVPEPSDPLVKERPVRWAVEELRSRLAARRVAADVAPSLEKAPPQTLTILVAGRSSPVAQRVLQAAGTSIPHDPEALGLVRGQVADRPVLLVSGSDARGLVYGLLEVADRVEHTKDPLSEIRRIHRVVEQPANPIRSISRHFCSAVEDKPWFSDKSFWPDYLSMLIAERFNRFSLGLGLGYDAPRGILDSYFYFAYPFLVSVPGHRVKAGGLSDEERDANLAMLRWISDEANTRGLHFQLALWTHAYDFRDSSKVNYPIVGLRPENHAAYCRDALHVLLDACPSIRGVTFRCHSESGIPQGSYEFWRTVFDGVRHAGRKVEIDIHSKGIEPRLLDMALETGMPINVSPKYWAEHMGLPYHQAAIRPNEWQRPKAGRKTDVESQRRFTRYGYADYLREDRKYGILYRLWPGTQRFLLWADPVLAAGYGRHAHFCGGSGLELFEPFSFKGRKGSGLSGGRDSYANAALKTRGGDWRKHAYGYRVWGRLLYNPESPPDVWSRFLGKEFGPAGADCGAALAHASRILPLLTTAHLPSAANNSFWPEIYTNMPIVDAARKHPYGDTPSPKRFSTVSPLDPALFSTIEEYAGELVNGRASGKYSAVDVARWLDALAKASESHLASAEAKASDRDAPALRRLAVDVRIQSGLGRFFAEKFRAAVAYACFERSADRRLLEEALKRYRAAREAWAQLADEANGVYVADITYGLIPNLRGHWSDRLEAIDADLADMQQKAQTPPAASTFKTSEAIAGLFENLFDRAPTPRPACHHQFPASFRRGQPVFIELIVEGTDQPQVRLFYRHVNQADEYRTADMSSDKGRYGAVIPGAYTDSPYPMLYYFQLRSSRGDAWLHPGLAEDLASQPYFVVRQG